MIERYGVSQPLALRQLTRHLLASAAGLFSFTEYDRPHFLWRRDSAWERHRDKTGAIKQGMRRLSAPHRPGVAGMREFAPRSGERRDTAERCHEGLRHLLPKVEQWIKFVFPVNFLN